MRRFFGDIFGMRNFGLNFPPPYFFKKVARRGGEVGSNTADIAPNSMEVESVTTETDDSTSPHTRIQYFF